MVISEISVTDLKARCTSIVREVYSGRQPVLITKRGKVVAVITPPGEEKGLDPGSWIGSLRGSVAYLKDWDEPLGEAEWEATQ